MPKQDTEVSIKKLQDTAFKAAEAAQKITLSYFRQNDLGTSDKKKDGAWDPVTLADQGAEKEIRKVIEATFPDHNILGEEFGHKNIGSDYEWVIDPIDGTRAFMTGLTVWGTLIGVTYKGHPIFGMMHQPYNDDYFYGANDYAFLRHKDQITPLKTRQNIPLEEAHLMCTSPDIFKSEYDIASFSALKDNILHARFGTDCSGFMSVALGCADMVFETGLSPYDFVPLLPILKGAGAVYTNRDGGDDLSKGDILACGSQSLHDEALTILKNI